jgi:hypothetical protein
MVGYGTTSFSDALGINGNGSVIFGNLSWRAFVRDAHDGIRSIADILIASGFDLRCWKLLQAYDVSADGRIIVGSGVIGDGPELPWVAVLPPNVFAAPEPTTFVLFLIALFPSTRGITHFLRPASPC